MTDLIVGDDGLARCAWAGQHADYVHYHDTEWGQPVRDETGLYERLCLEGFQSGLSWLTILRKREAFREAFAGFVPDVVANYTALDVDRLLGNADIIRHRGKITATITNARATIALRGHPAGPLPDLLWKYANRERSAPATLAKVPGSTDSSTALARELKSHGFRFVGPTTVYAAMQACGIVNDHLSGCHHRPYRTR